MTTLWQTRVYDPITGQWVDTSPAPLPDPQSPPPSIYVGPAGPQGAQGSTGPQGTQGVVGPTGAVGANTHVTVTAGQDISAGQAVRVANDGSIRLAQADAWGNVKGFAGLAIAAAGNGFSCEASPDKITLADWTLVTGLVALSPSALYFLDPSTAGRLTQTVPTTVGQLVVAVGAAVSTTTISLIPFSIIQL